MTTKMHVAEASKSILESGALSPSTIQAVPIDADAMQTTLPGFGTASISASSMNLLNAMMGSGIIGLPFAIHLCGFWLGLACSVIIGFLSCMAISLTVDCGIHTNCYSLADLCAMLLGRFGHPICNFILLFHTLVTGVSYYIMLADIVCGLSQYYLPQYPFLAHRTTVVFVFGLAFGLPLSLPRSPARLAKWSALSVIFLPIMQIGVMVRLHHYVPRWQDLDLEVMPVSNDMFKGVAIMALAFGCSQNIFGLYLSTRDQRPSTWLLISCIATTLAYVFNFAFAVLGYLCFGKDVKENVLLNFPLDDACINMVRLALATFLMITIPTCIYPCRDALQALRGKFKHGQVPSDMDHKLTTCLLFLPILYFGATLTSLGTVFDILGGVSTMMLGFLLPGIMYLRLYFGRPMDDTKPLLYTPPPRDPLTGMQAFLACILVTVGMVVLYFTLADYL